MSAKPYSDRDVLTESLVSLVMSGLSLREAALRLDIKYDTAVNWANSNSKYRAWKAQHFSGAGRPSEGSMYLRIASQAIYMRDVEFYKDIVNEGESVCYDINEYGYREYAVIEKKYPHFAKTDKGGIPWTWLTVMNRERIGK